jgi:hypothetical protein
MHYRAASLTLVAAAALLSIGLTGCGGLPPVDDGGGGGTVVVLVVEAETSVPLAVNATVTVGGVRGELRPTDQQLILRAMPDRHRHPAHAAAHGQCPGLQDRDAAGADAGDGGDVGHGRDDARRSRN